MKLKKVYIAGHNGMVGSSILRLLKKEKKYKIITKSKNQLDLTRQEHVCNFFKKNKFDQVYLSAAKVGGIYANNKYPAQFIYENLIIQSNIIHSSYLTGVKKLLFLGSSCIYPKLSKQPIKEDRLLSGKLECTNEPYAIAKIAGIKMCESYNRQYNKTHNLDYRCIMPTNLYGPGDKYDKKNSHVIPSLILKFHQAKIKNKPSVVVWGSGKPKREFLHVDDLASASYFVMNLKKKKILENTKLMCSHINVGYGTDISILELSKLIKNIVGYKGHIQFDRRKLEGPDRKFLNSNILKKLGWKPKISLAEGLKSVYEDFKKNL